MNTAIHVLYAYVGLVFLVALVVIGLGLCAVVWWAMRPPKNKDGVRYRGRTWWVER